MYLHNTWRFIHQSCCVFFISGFYFLHFLLHGFMFAQFLVSTSANLLIFFLQFLKEMKYLRVFLHL